MQKELNPELFGMVSTSRYVQTSGDPEVRSQQSLEARVFELKDQLHQQAEQFSTWASQITEFVKNTHMKFDRIHQTLGKLDQVQNSLTQETTQKFSYIQTKLGERRSIDQKTHEMVDRHNSVLRTYEVRMGQLQKLISEREAQLLQAQAALNEARMEIARLKRL